MENKIEELSMQLTKKIEALLYGNKEDILLGVAALYLEIEQEENNISSLKIKRNYLLDLASYAIENNEEELRAS